MKQMTRYGYFLGVALLTFGAGVGASLLHRSAVARPFSATDVQIRFKSSVKAGGDIWSEFEVVNKSAHVLRYRGYGRNSNEYWHRRRGAEVKSFAAWCGTGLAERTLLPGDAATFKVSVEDAGPVRFGFNFLVGEGRSPQTIWSDEVFINEPLSADGN